MSMGTEIFDIIGNFEKKYNLRKNKKVVDNKKKFEYNKNEFEEKDKHYIKKLRKENQT